MDRYRQGPGWDREAGLSILHVRESMDEKLVQQAGTQWLCQSQQMSKDGGHSRKIFFFFVKGLF